ncbi:hypothetical protein HMI55_003806 [Coelomomyces lativittatus]|nr:hypothetical protein HMI55_003806 [Coelomomyces lativittatus]
MSPPTTTSSTPLKSKLKSPAFSIVIEVPSPSSSSSSLKNKSSRNSNNNDNKLENTDFLHSSSSSSLESSLPKSNLNKVPLTKQFPLPSTRSKKLKLNPQPLIKNTAGPNEKKIASPRSIHSALKLKTTTSSASSLPQRLKLTPPKRFNKTWIKSKTSKNLTLPTTIPQKGKSSYSPTAFSSSSASSSNQIQPQKVAVTPDSIPSKSENEINKTATTTPIPTQLKPPRKKGAVASTPATLSAPVTYSSNTTSSPLIPMARSVDHVTSQTGTSKRKRSSSTSILTNNLHHLQTSSSFIQEKNSPLTVMNSSPKTHPYLKTKKIKFQDLEQIQLPISTSTSLNNQKCQPNLPPLSSKMTDTPQHQPQDFEFQLDSKLKQMFTSFQDELLLRIEAQQARFLAAFHSMLPTMMIPSICPELPKEEIPPFSISSASSSMEQDESVTKKQRFQFMEDELLPFTSTSYLSPSVSLEKDTTTGTSHLNALKMELDRMEIVNEQVKCALLTEPDVSDTMTTAPTTSSLIEENQQERNENASTLLTLSNDAVAVHSPWMDEDVIENEVSLKILDPTDASLDPSTTVEAMDTLPTIIEPVSHQPCIQEITKEDAAGMLLRESNNTVETSTNVEDLETLHTISEPVSVQPCAEDVMEDSSSLNMLDPSVLNTPINLEKIQTLPIISEPLSLQPCIEEIIEDKGSYNFVDPSISLEPSIHVEAVETLPTLSEPITMQSPFMNGIEEKESSLNILELASAVDLSMNMEDIDALPTLTEPISEQPCTREIIGPLTSSFDFLEPHIPMENTTMNMKEIETFSNLDEVMPIEPIVPEDSIEQEPPFLIDPIMTFTPSSSLETLPITSPMKSEDVNDTPSSINPSEIHPDSVFKTHTTPHPSDNHVPDLRSSLSTSSSSFVTQLNIYETHKEMDSDFINAPSRSTLLSKTSTTSTTAIMNYTNLSLDSSKASSTTVTVSDSNFCSPSTFGILPSDPCMHLKSMDIDTLMHPVNMDEDVEDPLDAHHPPLSNWNEERVSVAHQETKFSALSFSSFSGR